jgi:hypothetical protein
LFEGEARSEAALALVTVSQQAQILVLDVSGHDAYRRTRAYLMRRGAAERGECPSASERAGSAIRRFCKSGPSRERLSAGDREVRNNKRQA